MTHLLCTLRVRGRWDPSEERLGYLPPKQPGGARPRLLLPHGPWPGLRTEGLISNELSTPEGGKRPCGCARAAPPHTQYTHARASHTYTHTCLTHTHARFTRVHTCHTHTQHALHVCTPHMCLTCRHSHRQSHIPVCTHTRLTCTHTECTYLAHVYMHASRAHTHASCSTRAQNDSHHPEAEANECVETEAQALALYRSPGGVPGSDGKCGKVPCLGLQRATYPGVCIWPLRLGLQPQCQQELLWAPSWTDSTPGRAVSGPQTYRP